MDLMDFDISNQLKATVPKRRKRGKILAVSDVATTTGRQTEKIFYTQHSSSSLEIL